MAKSVRLKELLKRSTELRNHFLPKELDPLGNYSNRQYDRTRAYKLLCHSEIEAYIEDRTREIATRAVNEWEFYSKPNKVSISLLAFSGMEHDVPPQTLTPRTTNIVNQTTTSILKKTLTSFYRTIKNNNGIKESNLLSLLYPIGIEESDLDSTWLIDMNNFGTQRGEIAHTSIRTQTAIDPMIELNKVRQLLRGIGLLDQKLNDLLK